MLRDTFYVLKAVDCKYIPTSMCFTEQVTEHCTGTQGVVRSKMLAILLCSTYERCLCHAK